MHIWVYSYSLVIVMEETVIQFSHHHVIPQQTIIPVLICICLPPPHPGFSFLNSKPVRYLRACLELYSVWRGKVSKVKQQRIILSLTVSMHKAFHFTYMWIHLHYDKIPPAPIFHFPNSFTPFFPCITHFSSPIYSVGPVQLHPAPPLSYKPPILHLLSSHTHPALTFTAEGGEETVWRVAKEGSDYILSCCLHHSITANKLVQVITSISQGSYQWIWPCVWTYCCIASAIVTIKWVHLKFSSWCYVSPPESVDYNNIMLLAVPPFHCRSIQE